MLAVETALVPTVEAPWCRPWRRALVPAVRRPGADRGGALVMAVEAPWCRPWRRLGAGRGGVTCRPRHTDGTEPEVSRLDPYHWPSFPVAPIMED